MDKFDPLKPNTKREITVTYETDESGAVSISIDSKGFEGGENYVGIFLNNTLQVLSEITSPVEDN